MQTNTLHVLYRLFTDALRRIKKHALTQKAPPYARYKDGEQIDLYGIHPYFPAVRFWSNFIFFYKVFYE